MVSEDLDLMDIRATCPDCSSEKVVVEETHGYFRVVLCHKCGYKIRNDIFVR